MSPKIAGQFRNILYDNSCINIDTQNLYKTNGWRKPFKLLKSKKNINILNREFNNIFFENCYGFLSDNT